MTRRTFLTMAGLGRPALTAALAAGVVGALAVGAAASPGSGQQAAAGHQATSAPLAGTWKPLPKAPVTKLPDIVNSVWTGQQMIIHGVRFTRQGLGRVTFAYNPAAGTWAQLARGPKPLSGLEATDVSVWTGSEMLVMGLTNGAYKPATDTWRPIARGAGPDEAAVVAWTGHEAIVWGGVCCAGTSNNGTAYNPAANTWRKLPTAPMQPRRDAMGAWTGKVLVVAGGSKTTSTGARALRSAAAYNPVTNTWRRLAPMPRVRTGGTALWDGHEVLFLGGNTTSGRQPSRRGMAYNPATNHWRLLPLMQFRRSGFAAVWTGRHVLVWGGLSGISPDWVIPPNGETYNPATNRWRDLPKSPLHGRMVAASVWTGHAMIVWGGHIPLESRWQTFLDGAMFQPRWP